MGDSCHGNSGAEMLMIVILLMEVLMVVMVLMGLFEVVVVMVLAQHYWRRCWW